MVLRLICVGGRMPQWVQQGTKEYSRRIRHELGFHVVEVPMARRGKSISSAVCLDKEASGILHRINAGDYVVALHVLGEVITTEELARRLQQLRAAGQPVCLVIGGPDGLSDRVRQRANASWSLSSLTLPHTLARIVMVEQLYRAHSILQGHPYHRQ